MTEKTNSQTAYKWLPVIDQDNCIGCGLCQKACTPKSIELVWDFATLTRPEACASCGDCVPVCPQDGIHMEWVKAAGNSETGKWCDTPPPPPEKPKAKPWFMALLEGGSKTT